MNHKLVDLYILSGFLGSGKTTLLQQLLAEEKRRQRKVAVLMNEVGDVSIDTTLLPSEIPLKELLNGCICCTIQDQLTNQLLSLCQQHEPDVIYIEATGVAHPIEVLEACIAPLVACYLKTCKIVTTLDLLRWRDRDHLSIQAERLIEDQVRYSDFLVINKASEVSSEERDTLVTEIRQYNDQVSYVVTDFSQFDASLLLDQVAKQSSFARLDLKQPAHLHHHLHVRTFSYTWEKPVDRQAFEKWLQSTPDTLYRAKGYLRFKDNPKQTYLFQYSYGMPRWVEEPFPYPLTIVLIGDHLSVQELQHQLKQIS